MKSFSILQSYLDGEVLQGPACGDREDPALPEKVVHGLPVFGGDTAVLVVEGIVVVAGQQDAVKLAHGPFLLSGEILKSQSFIILL